VREGTATFELTSPDLPEMTRRFRALVDGDAGTVIFDPEKWLRK